MSFRSRGDLSFIYIFNVPVSRNCEPGRGGGLRVRPSEESRQIADGGFPSPSQVGVRPDSRDLLLTLYVEGVSGRR